MQIKKVKVGYLQEGNVNRFLSTLLLFSLLIVSTQIYSQKSSPILLQKALLDIAKYEKKSIVFSSSNIPDKSVLPLSNSKPLKDRLSHILLDTDIFFKIDDAQIFLYKKRKLFGYIEDGQSGERLISALIFLPSTGEYEVTNDFGYFTISTQLDSLEMEVSYIGFATQRLVFREDRLDRSVVIGLEPDNSLSEILITDNLVTQDDRKYIELDKGSDILLNQNQAVTALGGEPDLFQAMIRQSGVSSGSEGIGGVHVRGGKSDQNLVLLDGVKLYNSSHAFGMFSNVNASVVDQVKLHKSGASGAVSGRLSSILDIKTKDPNLKRIKGNAQFSTLAGQATLELPIITDRLGVLVSGRHTYIDPYINHISNKSVNDFEIDGESGYSFHDVNMKLYGKINDKNRLYFTAYQGSDSYTDDYFENFLDYIPAYYLDEDVSYKWKNQLGSLRWNRLIGKSSFANFQLSGYKYDYRNKYEIGVFDEFEEDYLSYSQYRAYNAQITNYEAKVDIETVLDNHHLKYGINASKKSYQIGELIDTLIEREDGNFPEQSLEDFEGVRFLGYGNEEVTIYLSDKMKIRNSWMLEGGIYQTLHQSSDDGIAISPLWGTHGYLKTLNKISQQIYIGASVGSFIQTEHLLTQADNGYPNDIWVPSTDLIPFQRSNQIEVFSEIELNRHEFRLSSYYKRQSGILRYADYANQPSLADIFPERWEIEVELGNAEGYGFEFDYSYKYEDKIDFQGTYSYGNSMYRFDGINGGAAFPFDYSIPHTLSLRTNLKLSGRLRIIVDWFFSSGKPFTLYESFENYSPLSIDPILDGGEVSQENEFRLPNIHKLSFMFSTSWKWSSVQNNLSFGVQNVYNRQNIILQYQLIDEGIQSQQGFPILPMVLYRGSF